MVSSQEFNSAEQKYSRTPFGDRIDKASVNMIKEAYLTSKEPNVITSPLGVFLLLSLYSSTVGDESRNEIMTLLGSRDYKEQVNFYTSLGDKFASVDPSHLTLANKIYVAKGFTLTEELSNTARSYRSEVDSIDFRDTKTAASIINRWANEKTKGLIKNPVSEDSLDKDTAIALCDVIFFMGHWQVPFMTEDTEEKDFHVNASVIVKKPMMHLEDHSLFYHEDKEIGTRMIELPYKESGLRMVVILPNEVEGLASVLEKVSKKGFLEDVFALQKLKVNLYMPKFEIKSNLDYKSILLKLGVKKIFAEGAPGIVRESSVAVSEFFQEAIVKVDEEGATAGAFTTNRFTPLIYQPRTDFIMDRPFLFAILHEDVILFTGIYAQ